MSLSDSLYVAAIPVYDPKISETRHAGLTVLRLCSCGLPMLSGKNVIGQWRCVHCGRLVA